MYKYELRERERERERERFLINRFLLDLKLMEAQKTCLIMYVHISLKKVM